MQPEKVATPEDAALVVPPVHDSVAPGVPVPGVIERVTGRALEVTVWPNMSVTETDGWTTKAVFEPADALGWVATVRPAGGAGLIANVVLVAAGSPAVVATSLKPVPALLTEQPAKVATPATAATVVPPVQARTAPAVPVPDRIASVTVAVLAVTVLPTESSTVTTGCVSKGTPAAPPAGCVVKAIAAGGPGTTLNGALVPPVRPVAVAVIA